MIQDPNVVVSTFVTSSGSQRLAAYDVDEEQWGIGPMFSQDVELPRLAIGLGAGSEADAVGLSLPTEQTKPRSGSTQTFSYLPSFSPVTP